MGLERECGQAILLSLLHPGSVVPGSPFFISRAELTVGLEQDKFGFGR